MKAVIADLSGTLLEISENDKSQASARCSLILNEFGADVTARQYEEELREAFAAYDVFRHFHQIEIDEVGFYYRYFFPRLTDRKLAIPAYVVHDLIETWMRYAVSVRLNDGVPELLTYLNAQGLKLGVVADLMGHMYRRELERLGILAKIDSLILSSETGIRKPHPRAFSLCLEQLGCSAADAVFVGNDPEDDIKGAKTSGLRTIFLRTRHHPESSFSDFEVDSLYEVPSILRGIIRGEKSGALRENTAKIEEEIISGITASVTELQGVLFFGGFNSKKLYPGSDIDVLVICNSISREDLRRLADFQRDFNMMSPYPLSIHVSDSRTLDYWNRGRNVVRHLAILENSKLVFGKIEWPDFPSKEAIIEGFREEVWEMFRICMYNTCNSNPCGRIFNSKDIIVFSGDSWLADYLKKHHFKMIKHLLAIVKIASNFLSLAPLIERLENVISEIEKKGEIDDALIYETIAHAYKTVCCQ